MLYWEHFTTLEIVDFTHLAPYTPVKTGGQMNTIVKSSATNKFTSSFFSPGTKLGGRVVNYGSNAITGYAPVWNYTTIQGKILDIGVTGAGVSNTIYGMNRE